MRANRCIDVQTVNHYDIATASLINPIKDLDHKLVRINHPLVSRLKTANLSELLFAASAIFWCLFFLLPDLVLMRATPMMGDGMTLKDPNVSWGAFMPALREFRYELLNHGNVLWSNLRATGQPLLGNTVQAAPLFPLNLALIWLPDTSYWSVMPLLRLGLIALVCFLLARRIFGLSISASLAFALVAGFNLNVIRWVNHPCDLVLKQD